MCNQLHKPKKKTTNPFVLSHSSLASFRKKGFLTWLTLVQNVPEVQGFNIMDLPPSFAPGSSDWGTASCSDTALILPPALSLSMHSLGLSPVKNKIHLCSTRRWFAAPDFPEILFQTRAASDSSLHCNTPAIKQQVVVKILHLSAFRISREADSCMETAPEKLNFRSLIKEINHHIHVSQGKPSPGRSWKSGCENNFSCILRAQTSVRPVGCWPFTFFSGALKLSLTVQSLLPFQC